MVHGDLTLPGRQHPSFAPAAAIVPREGEQALPGEPSRAEPIRRAGQHLRRGPARRSREARLRWAAGPAKGGRARLLPGATAGRAGARRSPQVRGGRAGPGRAGPGRDGGLAGFRRRGAEGRGGLRGAGGGEARGRRVDGEGRDSFPGGTWGGARGPGSEASGRGPAGKAAPGGAKGVWAFAVVGLRRRDRRQKAPAGRGASGFCPQQGS